MSDEKNAIPLMESNSSAPPVSPRRKRRNNGKCELFKAIVFVFLVILVFVLIAALVISLFRKCDVGPPSEKKTPDVPRPIRQNNSYWNSVDLPNFAHPKRYELTLQLLREALTLAEHNTSHYFYGFVAINITMSARTQFLVLHSQNLSIKSIKIKHIEKPLKKKPIEIIKTFYDPFFKQLILDLSEPLLKSKGYTLEILYSGNITTDKSGIIRTFYRNFVYNKTYDILYSKLEPLGARRMFPCFDEPDKKALFSVRIIHNSKYTALSNMPSLRSESIDYSKLIVADDTVSINSSVSLSVFNCTTISMSTYLVAFVLVEDYTSLTQERKPGFNVSVWGPDGFQDSGKVALQYSVASETFLEQYLDYPSPMPKTDHIYIPNFLSGAMENWGLITYREKHLLMSPKQGEFSSKKAYMTIAHELAHIWFGNWVTMRTWRDLWLNEGFATYFASYAYFKQLPLSLLNEDELSLYYQRQVLDKDGLPSSSPVRLSTTNINQMFNSFTYSKGQALLVWLNSIMGEEQFRLGIHNYIKKYATKSPTTEQFFDEMQRNVRDNLTFKTLLKDFFNPWLNRIGYPVLTVNYDIHNKQMILSQHSIVKNATSNSTWPIYTTYKTNKKSLSEAIYFNQNVFRVNLSLEETEPVLINAEGKSYLRVNYSGFLWSKIIEGIRSNNNHIINNVSKLVLFDDMLYFADNNLIDIALTKSLIDTLENETNLMPWSAFFNSMFTKSFDLLRDDQMFLKWTKYVKKLSAKILQKTFQRGIDGKFNFDDEIYQRQVFVINCLSDNNAVLDYMSAKFKVWLKNPKTETLPKHLTTSILFYGMKTNDRSDNWLKMWKVMTDKDQSQFVDRDMLAIGMAGTSRPYLLVKLLNYFLQNRTHSSDIDKQSFVNTLITWMLQSNNGATVLQKWIVNNYIKIKQFAFGDNVPMDTAQSSLEMIIRQIASTTYDVNVIRPLLKLTRNDKALQKIINQNNKWRNNVGLKLFKLL